MIVNIKLYLRFPRLIFCSIYDAFLALSWEVLPLDPIETTPIESLRSHLGIASISAPRLRAVAASLLRPRAKRCGFTWPNDMWWPLDNLGISDGKHMENHGTCMYIYICVCVCRMGSVGSTNGNGDFRQQKLGRQNEAVLASKSGVGNRRNAGLNPILAGHLWI